MTRGRTALLAGGVAALLGTGPIAAALIWVLPPNRRSVWVVWGVTVVVFIVATATT